MEGRTILSLLQNRPNLRFPFPDRFAERVSGARIERLGRRAKFLTADLSTGEVLVMHLGMTGRFTVGGGATARVGRLLGADRMTEMMLTGRKFGAAEGTALGLAHYAVGEGEAMALAQTLAARIARNAPMSNYLMIQSIARINDMSQSDGLFVESLAAALSQTTPDAEEGLRAFLEKRAPKFR